MESYPFTFEQLCDYLKSIRNTWAAGTNVLPGTVVEASKSKKRQIFHETGANKITPLLDVQPADGSLIQHPSRGITFIFNRKESYRLSIRNPNAQQISFEGPINPEKCDEPRNWLMGKNQKGESELYFDATDYDAQLVYRFTANNKTLPDPNVSTVSFIPGCGTFNTVKFENEFKVHVAIPQSVIDKKFNKKSNPDFTKRKIFRILSYPGWLFPLNKESTADRYGILNFSFKLKATTDMGPVESGELSIKRKGAKKKFNILIKFKQTDPGIWAIPEQAQIDESARMALGRKVALDIPFSIHHRGTLKMDFSGPGINQQHMLTADSHATTVRNVKVSVDTSKLLPSIAKNFRLLVRTDAKLANRRNSEILIHLNLASIKIFPINRLEWPDSPWGSRSTRLLEFFDSSTAEPMVHIDFDVPENLKRVIGMEYLPDQPHAQLFIFNTTRLLPGASITGQIDVSGRCRDELILQAKLPVTAAAAAPKISIELRSDHHTGQKKEGQLLQMEIKNHGPDQLHLFGISWAEGMFNRHYLPSERGVPDQNILSSGEKLQYLFKSNRKARWLRTRKVYDVLTIESNSLNDPHFSRGVTLFLPPMIRTFSKKTGIEIKDVDKINRRGHMNES